MAPKMETTMAPDSSSVIQTAAMRAFQRRSDPYSAAKTASHWYLDCQRASTTGRLCSSGSCLAVSWASPTSSATLKAKTTVSSTQTVTQTAQLSASPTQKDPSTANANQKGKKPNNVSCTYRRMETSQHRKLTPHTCEDGSVDTEGRVESDGDSDGALVLK